jgi:hypothetical protein
MVDEDMCVFVCEYIVPTETDTNVELQSHNGREICVFVDKVEPKVRPPQRTEEQFGRMRMDGWMEVANPGK